MSGTPEGALFGIRREDKNRWEARTPLTPAQVKEAMESQNLDFIVQSSPVRAFDDESYRSEGIEVSGDISGADIILSIKEVPIKALHPGKVHLFFSHTFKGQPYNFPMLREIVKQGITLIDYEKITDENGRRLVYFGNWAGYAGLMDTLYAFGLRKNQQGVPNPFQGLKPAYEYGSLSMLRAAVAEVGRSIESGHLPPAVTPLVIGITGYGNVSRGVQDLCSELPVMQISPDVLLSTPRENLRSDTVYMVVFHEEHTVKRRDAGPFELSEYYRTPEAYESTFSQYLPHLSILINAVYWDSQYPRLVTDEAIAALYASKNPHLSVIGDISCDIEGAIEVTKESTEPDRPMYVWNPDTREISYGVEGKGPVIMAVDNLPCELPRESSETFGGSLKPFLPALAQADFGDNFDDLQLPGPLKKAVIVHRGEFTPLYEYMKDFLS